MIEHYFNCPHCWQNQLKIIDSSVEEQSFIEDCEVCCNPLEFELKITNQDLEFFTVVQIGQ